MFFRKFKVRYQDNIFTNNMQLRMSFFMMPILPICGDIESNPGSKRHDSCYNFSICHWNLNSMSAHNFAKINLFETCNSITKFNIICLLEPHLDSSIAYDNGDTYIKGYNLYKVNALYKGNLEKLIINVYSCKAGFVLMIGDLNAKSCNQSINNTTTPEGAHLDSITSLYGMKQLI